jgi:hypothetical protein
MSPAKKAIFSQVLGSSPKETECVFNPLGTRNFIKLIFRSFVIYENNQKTAPKKIPSSLYQRYPSGNTTRWQLCLNRVNEPFK